MSFHAQAIIARCTRNGVTSWQHVAQQMGCSVDKARGLYDSAYLRFYAGCSPIREPEPEMKPRAEDLEPPKLSMVEERKSPIVKRSPLKLRILLALKVHTASAETISGLVGSPVGSVRATLSILKVDGYVQHTWQMPYTWNLTPMGASELAPKVIPIAQAKAARRDRRGGVQSGRLKASMTRARA